MSFVIEENWLPAILTAPPMTDEQFAELCAEHPELFFEVTAQGDLIVMPPNFTVSGIRNAELVRQLTNWAIQDCRGVTSDPSAGFVLPSGARRSPDAAWILKSRLSELDPASLNRYWHLCPDFVVELRSPSDRLPVLREKIQEWMENGAVVGWLIDPERRAVEIFRKGVAVETLSGPESIEGEGPVKDFVLDLVPVWDPLSR